jgi:5,10-methylenetetrahydrofolate reductase
MSAEGVAAPRSGWKRTDRMMSERESGAVAYRVRSMLDRGEWVVSVELDPPRGFSAEGGLRTARRLREAGVDCVDVGDSPMASVRMSSVAFAVAVQQQTGLEAVVHLGARDRNLLALRSDIMGAHMLGIRSIIALSGDPLKAGRYEGATAVWDVKAEGLIELIAELNADMAGEGADLSEEGKGSRSAEAFTIAAAANPNNPDLDAEVERMRVKADRGAEVFFTQPTFEPSTVEAFAERAAAVGRPVVLGVLLLSSARTARFMAEVPGIALSESIVERMESAGPEAAAVGLELTQAFLEQVRPLCAGIYIIPSMGSMDSAVQLVEGIRG